jgi:tight adherence protein C
MKNWWSRSDGPINLAGFEFNEWTAMLVVFALVFAVTFLLLVLLRPTDDDPNSLEPARRWFGFLTPSIANMVPASEEVRKEVQLDLYMAGYTQPQMPDNFFALRSVTTLGPIFTGLLIALFGPDWALLPGVIGGIVLGVLGFAVPRVLLQSEAKSRAERLRQGLPVLMDTLSMCLSTGNSLSDSFQRSGESLRRGYPDLHHEIKVVNKQAELRSLEHALLQWKDRIPLPELSSLVFLLAQGDKLGTDVTRGLLELSSSYRVNSRQAADTAANRVSLWMLFPTVLCLLVSGVILIAGPGILAGVKQGVKISDTLKNAEKKAEQIREESKKAGETGTVFGKGAKNEKPKLPGTTATALTPTPAAPAPAPPSPGL